MVSSALSWAAGAYLLALTVGRYAGLAEVRRHHVESASFVFVALLLGAILWRRTATETTRAFGPAPGLPIIAGVFVAASILLYGPALTSGLFADDYVLLDAARQGRWTVWSDLFRPVIFLAWRVVDAIAPDTALSLHILNSLVHAGNAVLTVLLSQRVGLEGWPAAAAGLVFLCFPGSVEPVAWPAGIQDVLMTTFALGFVLLATHPRLSTARGLGALVLFVAACLTKEPGIAALVLGVLVAVVVRAERRVWLLLGFATLAALVLVGLRLSLLPLPAQYGVVSSRYEVKELLVQPFATLIVPLRATEAVRMPWLATTMVAAVVVGLGLAAATWSRRSHAFHVALLSVGMVLACAAIVNRLFHINADLLGSRYLYLGTAGWSILIATLFRELRARSVVLSAILALMILPGWVLAARLHVNLWKQAAAERDAILDAATAAASAACAETVVTELPAIRNGVPLFVNGFPEAMRERLPNAPFRVGAYAEKDGCSLVWTGAGFRRP